MRSLKNPLQAWQACHLCKFQGNDEETTLKETKSDDKCAEPLNSMWTLLAQIHNKSNDVEMSDFFFFLCVPQLLLLLLFWEVPSVVSNKKLQQEKCGGVTMYQINSLA